MNCKTRTATLEDLEDDTREILENLESDTLDILEDLYGLQLRNQEYWKTRLYDTNLLPRLDEQIYLLSGAVAHLTEARLKLAALQQRTKRRTRDERRYERDDA